MLRFFLVDIGSSLIIINKINIYHLLFALNIYLYHFYQHFLSCSTVIYSSRYISSGKYHIDLEFLFSYEKKKSLMTEKRWETGVSLMSITVEGVKKKKRTHSLHKIKVKLDIYLFISSFFTTSYRFIVFCHFYSSISKVIYYFIIPFSSRLYGRFVTTITR